MGGRFKREGIYLYLWLIHTDVWQKPTQNCKAVILQLKINKILKMLHSSWQLEWNTSHSTFHESLILQHHSTTQMTQPIREKSFSEIIAHIINIIVVSNQKKQKGER